MNAIRRLGVILLGAGALVFLIIIVYNIFGGPRGKQPEPSQEGDGGAQQQPEPSQPKKPGPPTVTFDPDVTQGVAPLTVNFGFSATDDGNISAITFNPGDGSIEISVDPTANSFTYTFSKAGAYEAKLTAADDAGLTTTMVSQIVVQAGQITDQQVQQAVLEALQEVSK